MRRSLLAIPLISLWAVMALADPQPKPAAASASPGSLVGFLRGLDDAVLKRGGSQDKDNPVRYISAY